MLDLPVILSSILLLLPGYVGVMFYGLTNNNKIIDFGRVSVISILITSLSYLILDLLSKIRLFRFMSIDDINRIILGGDGKVGISYLTILLIFFKGSSLSIFVVIVANYLFKRFKIEKIIESRTGFTRETDIWRDYFINSWSNVLYVTTKDEKTYVGSLILASETSDSGSLILENAEVMDSEGNWSYIGDENLINRLFIAREDILRIAQVKVKE